MSGPDALRLATPVETRDEGVSQTAEFTVSEGEQVPFVLTWFASHEPEPPHLDPSYLVSDTERWWRSWSERCTYQGEWRDAVLRSLITLKALTYAPTGGVVAAPTTSLPEQLGGVRNWDYRYCWLRDASFTLAVLRQAGYEQEALAWQQWLLRAVAGEPEAIQIVYGPAGERRLDEWGRTGRRATKARHRCGSETRPHASFSSTSTVSLQTSSIRWLRKRGSTRAIRRSPAAHSNTSNRLGHSLTTESGKSADADATSPTRR